MTLTAAIKDQLCKLCNKNLFFIKMKQVLNCKVHNLGKTASRFLFWKVLICGDLLYLLPGDPEKGSCFQRFIAPIVLGRFG